MHTRLWLVGGVFLLGALSPVVLGRDPGLRDANAASTAPLPKTWLGVKVSAIPEALAAHISARGLMIENIAVGSPADSAGLQRFDVLLSLNGQAIASMENLLAAIGSAPAGGGAALVILRGGREQSLSITPTDRPVGQETRYKYESAAAEDSGYFGHALRRDAQGNWLLEPLGRLNQLPDPLTRLPEPGAPAWRSWLDTLKGAQQDPFRVFVQPNPDDPQGLFILPDDDALGNTEFTITLNVTENDTTLSIARAADGKITITRTAAGGKSETRTYDSMDALRAADPDAHAHLQRVVGVRTQRVFTALPNRARLRERQEEWRKSLTESLDQMRRADPDKPPVIRERRRSPAPVAPPTPPDGAVSESLSRSLRIAHDGRVFITITRNGETSRYEFDSKAQFEQQQPELYEQFRGLLEEGE